MYWQRRDKIKSIRVISDEPWIPLEMIQPYREINGEIEESEFLCELHSFSRSFTGIDERIREKPLRKFILLASSDIKLPHTRKESKWIKEEFGKSTGLNVKVIQKYTEAISAFENEEFDLFHV